MLFTALGCRAAEQAPANAAAAKEVSIRIAAMGGVQMDVWLGGKRLGFTPLEKKLKPGRYWLTASAESIMPLIQVVDVKPAGQQPGGQQAVLLPTVPVTQENYAEVATWILSEIPKKKQNPHLVLMALQLTHDPAESKRLLAVADVAIPNDPMANVLRAQSLGRAGQLDEALKAADRATAAANYVAYAWRVRADVLRATGRLDEALQSANKAVLLDPRDFRNLRMRAKVHGEMGHEREQKADADRADELYAALHKRAEEASRKAKKGS